MQYALIFYDLQLILAPMALAVAVPLLTVTYGAELARWSLRR